MASHEELLFDWSLLPLYKDFKTWTQTDLQLAAELGKTLLERNKELECNLKHHQLIIDDQSQEIEYLTKQTSALRAANESRLKLYENLEVSILDLERGNHRLTAENVSLQKQNKSFKTNTESLEGRCEELTKLNDELNAKLETERKKSERISQEQQRIKCTEDARKLELKRVSLPSSPLDRNENSSKSHTAERSQISAHSENISFSIKKNQHNVLPSDEIHSTDTLDSLNVEEEEEDDRHLPSSEKNEEMLGLLTELEITRRQCISEQQHVAELEEQMNALIQENRNLQNCAAEMATNEEMKSMQDELSILEEVRYGKMCGRCLRNIDDDFTVADEDESIIDQDDGNDNTLRDPEEMSDIHLNSKTSDLHGLSSTMNKRLSCQGDLSEEQEIEQLTGRTMDNVNPYRELVEKYEALMEVQRHPPTLHKRHLSLNRTDYEGDLDKEVPRDFITDKENYKYKCQITDINSKAFGSRQPMSDFSEAETSSSGFADDISNKFTQTDGTFLCTIADGDDKFSIYDGARPIDSRFRNRPEYRELFKEIFAILKKAAENKDDGEKLPLLDDTNFVAATAGIVKVPPVTPAIEEMPMLFDDTESVVSSVMSEQSVAMSERITRNERKNIIENVKKHHMEKNELATLVNRSGLDQQILEDGRVLTPLKREPLEYLSVSVNIRKKKKKSKNNYHHDRSDSPLIPTPPRIFYSNSSGKKRREFRPLSNFPQSPGQNTSGWNGNSVTIYNQNLRHITTSSTEAAATSTMTTTKAENNISGSSNSGSSTPSAMIATNNVRKISPDVKKVSGKDIRKTSTASQDLHKLITLDLSYAEVLRRADNSKYQPQRRKF